MDFRQYDNALGRFYSPDALSELTYDQTPYHFGFNNPAFWSDPTGLFSSWGAANDHKMRYGLANAQINYNADKGVYQIDNEGYSFYQVGSDIISMYATQADGVVVNIIKGGGASGVGPDGGINPQIYGLISASGTAASIIETGAKRGEKLYSQEAVKNPNAAKKVVQSANLGKLMNKAGTIVNVVTVANDVYNVYTNPNARTVDYVKVGAKVGVIVLEGVINTAAPGLGIVTGIILNYIIDTYGDKMYEYVEDNYNRLIL